MTVQMSKAPGSLKLTTGKVLGAWRNYPAARAERFAPPDKPTPVCMAGVGWEGHLGGGSAPISVNQPDNYGLEACRCLSPGADAGFGPRTC